jgi:hypothetical protein
MRQADAADRLPAVRDRRELPSLLPPALPLDGGGFFDSLPLMGEGWGGGDRLNTGGNDRSIGFGHVTAEVPGALARTGAWRFLHHGSVLGVTPTPTLPHRGGGRDLLPARTGGELITPSTSIVAD